MIWRNLLQGDQLYMAVYFSGLVKSIRCTQCTVAHTGKVTFYKVPEQQSHVYLVGLYEKKLMALICGFKPAARRGLQGPPGSIRGSSTLLDLLDCDPDRTLV